MRLNASEINDDQLDVLQDTLDQIYRDHYPYVPGDRCTECNQRTPCRTARLISRQRSKIQESACPTEDETL